VTAALWTSFLQQRKALLAAAMRSSDAGARCLTGEQSGNQSCSKIHPVPNPDIQQAGLGGVAGLDKLTGAGTRDRARTPGSDRGCS
jgi:hypothetical protein